jgi:hypothetical protein
MKKPAKAFLLLDRIPTGTPFIQSTLHARHLLEAGLEQDVPFLLGAVVGTADDHNLLVARDLGKTRCKLIELIADVKLLPFRLASLRRRRV